MDLNTTYSRTCDAELFELAGRGAPVEHCREYFRAQHLSTIEHYKRESRAAMRRR